LAVIVAFNMASAFAVGLDPVTNGLVASLNRPGGNITGIVNLSSDLSAKRLELLHELLPAATTIAYLVNPTNPQLAEGELRETQVAASVTQFYTNSTLRRTTEDWTSALSAKVFGTTSRLISKKIALVREFSCQRRVFFKDDARTLPIRRPYFLENCNASGGCALKF
jgi:ABC-type uncharacterized transport system substrate-binding protein